MVWMKTDNDSVVDDSSNDYTEDSFDKFLSTEESDLINENGSNKDEKGS